MVDFNQMQTFSANPLIMVEGDGIRLTDHEGRRYIDGLSGVFAVSLGPRQRRDHRRDRGAAPAALVLVADHDDDRPGARARRRADPAHGRPLRRRQAALERIGGDGGGAQDGAPVPPPERQPRAVQDDLVLPLLPRGDDGRAHVDGLAAAADAVRAVPHRRDPRAPADPRLVPGLHGLVHPRLPRAAAGRDRARGPAHRLGDHRRAGDADGGRARALRRVPARAARALRRDRACS